jgi:hypothetical protein
MIIALVTRYLESSSLAEVLVKIRRSNRSPSKRTDTLPLLTLAVHRRNLPIHQARKSGVAHVLRRSDNGK